MGAINWRVVGPVIVLGIAAVAVFFVILGMLNGGDADADVPRVIDPISPTAARSTPTPDGTAHPGLATAIPATETPEASPTPEPTEGPTATPDPKRTATPTPASSTGVTAKAVLPSHVRAGPSLEDPVISDVFEGETVVVTGKDHDPPYWIRIQPGDGRPEGWSSADRFEIKGDLAKVPLIEFEEE